MKKSEIKALINLYLKVGELKKVKRTGWILNGVDENQAESVAAHSFRVAILAMLLSQTNLNQVRLTEMAILHDIGEYKIGDIKWETGKKVIGDQNAKHKDELKVIEELFGRVKFGKKYVDQLKDYNTKSSKEAKFLKLVDKLEMGIQTLEYEKKLPNLDLNEFWENLEKYLNRTVLKSFFQILKRMR